MTADFQRRVSGFSSVELLLALAIGAALIGAAAIAYGSIARSQPRVGSSVIVGLDSNKVGNFYNLGQSTVQASVAPSYGALAQAEDMRERFLADTLSATAVYCLSRTDINSYRPYSIIYNPATDLVLDTNVNFRQHLINKGLTSSGAFTNKRNYDATSTNATIFVLGYSSISTALTVSAIYEIDILRATSPATGYYASVRRYVATATSSAALTQYYDVYYPPPPTPPGSLKADTENFAPIWVSFERLNRKDKPETVDIDRFKAAREKPFYFIWWPDPSARTLGMQFASNNAYAPTDPRKVYNHMCGRTSFMFTVPMFPSL
ncbi:MAG: hypothetical protein JWO89_457 [Verrucomicrobiaceae bacterium]|nr:hypothetical protein [Verrucomicrobiaceae bacterium]